MKLLLTLLSIVIINTSTFAQNDHLNSPADAEVILTLRGGELFNKMSLEEMEGLPIMGDFFKNIIQMTGSNASSVKQLGIDLNKNAQYFMDIQDENIVMGMSFAISDQEKYKELFIGESQMEQNGDVSLSISEGFTKAIKGNEALITYVIQAPKNNMYDSYYYDDMYYEDSYYESDAVEEAEPVYEMYEEEIEELEMAEEEIEIIEEEIDVTEEIVEEEFDYEAYYLKQMQEAEERRMRKLAEEEARRKAEMDANILISKEYALNLFAKPKMTTKSVDLSTKLVDENADFSLLINDYMKSLTYFQKMNSGPYYYNPMEEFQNAITGIYDGIEHIAANGYFEKDGFKIEMKTKMNDQLANITKDLSKEFNSNMLKYIPFDSEIGHMTFSMNTENLISSYYDIARGFSSSLKPEEAAALDLGIDMASLFIDEEAIGNLFKGDMYFGITDLNSYEVEYTDYEYDENWNFTEVTKTKQEIRPDFLCMFSSEEAEIMDKVFKLISTTTNGEFKKVGDYYMMPSSRMVPLDIYCMHKEGIVFIFTSQNLFNFIANGGDKSKSARIADIKNNFSSIFFDAQALSNKIPLADMSEKEQEMLKYARENLSTMEMSQARMEGNVQTTTFSMGSKGNYSNSLEYFLSFFNELNMIERDFNSYRN